MCSCNQSDTDCRCEQRSTYKVSGGDSDRVAGSFAANRIDSPGDACAQHQRRTNQRWRGETRKDKYNKSSKCNNQSENLNEVQPLTRVESPDNHRDLDCTEQQ